MRFGPCCRSLHLDATTYIGEEKCAPCGVREEANMKRDMKWDEGRGRGGPLPEPAEGVGEGTRPRSRVTVKTAPLGIRWIPGRICWCLPTRCEAEDRPEKM